MDAQKIDIYRLRAVEMKYQAERAQTAELRASYLAMAEDWAQMADQRESAGTED